MKRTEDEKKWIMETKDKPQPEYIAKLHEELYMCYELLADIASHSLLRRHYSERAEVNSHFFHLINDEKFIIMMGGKSSNSELTTDSGKAKSV